MTVTTGRAGQQQARSAATCVRFGSSSSSLPRSAASRCAEWRCANPVLHRIRITPRQSGRAECIRRFRILDAGFAVGADLTPTQKVRRHYVLGKYATDVEALYGP